MFRLFANLRGNLDRRTPRRQTSPMLEGLEERQLLYATTGGLWSHPERITFSFVPDGTSVGGVASNLYSKMNQVASTAVWQAAFERAAAYWSSYANINLALVSDNGAPIGTPGNQQGDSRFGDIRIASIPQSSGVLAYALMPPPFNGGTDAGDLVFNSNINWHVNSDYDIETVALHEFGHALGLDHSAVSNAVMYAYYNGMKSSLTVDDALGIQSIYGAYPSDTTTNINYYQAQNLTWNINSAGQGAISNLSLSGGTDSDWFYVAAPANTTGRVTIAMQSTNLSTVAPRIIVYNAAMQYVTQNSLPNAYGATAAITITGVTPGQGFFIRCSAASGLGSYGAYGLLLNFGPYAQAPIQPPNTVVPEQADLGGGSMSDSLPSGGGTGQNNGNGNGSLFQGPLNRLHSVLNTVQLGSLSVAADTLTLKNLLADGGGSFGLTLPTLDDGSPITILPADRTVTVTVSMNDPTGVSQMISGGTSDSSTGSSGSCVVAAPPSVVDTVLSQLDGLWNSNRPGNRR